jgi:hypothetical protein
MEDVLRETLTLQLHQENITTNIDKIVQVGMVLVMVIAIQIV